MISQVLIIRLLEEATHSLGWSVVCPAQYKVEEYSTPKFQRIGSMVKITDTWN